MRCQCRDWTISVWHINNKWHAAAFHTKPFSSLPRTFPWRPSNLKIFLQSSSRRGHLEAYKTKILPLLHQRYIIRPPHHLPQGTLSNLVLSTPPIGHKTLPSSVIRGWRLMMKCNHTPRMFFWLTLLIMTHCLRYIYGGRVGIDHRDVVAHNQNEPSFKNFWTPKAFPTSTYYYTVSLPNGL